jgi:ABC-2 type transport system ATP-binding protein
VTALPLRLPLPVTAPATASATDPATATLSAVDLVRTFGAKVAVDGVSIRLARGEVLGLLGPNAAGKTTTLRMLTGNLAPTAGTVHVCGIDLEDAPVAAKTKLGYLPQRAPLYLEFDVDTFLVLAARLHRVPRARRRDAVATAKRRCGLETVGAQAIGTLSDGYRQRVGIAQAIVHEPDVVVLDEPTVSLDPNQVIEIRGLIRELASHHSVILSTHILSEVEAVCDRVQILRAGRVVFDDTIAALNGARAGHGWTLSLARPPADAAAVTAAPGIVEALPTGPGRWSVRLADETAAVDARVRTCVERDWGLRELAAQRASLEAVFVELTRSEAGPVATPAVAVAEAAT